MDSMSPRFALILSLLLLLCTSTVRAHEGDDARLATLTARLRAAPSVELFLARAVMRQARGDYAGAREDLRSAALLPAAPDARVHVAQAALERAAGDATAALAAAEVAVRLTPESAAAQLEHARALAASGRITDAARCYTALVAGGGARPDRPTGSEAADLRPDVYLEAARAVRRSGDLAGAVRVLDAGLARLGPLAALQVEAIAVQRAGGDWDGALTRLDALERGARRAESWLTLRAEVLLEAGRPAAAQAAALRARAALEGLPPRIRARAERVLGPRLDRIDGSGQEFEP